MREGTGRKMQKGDQHIFVRQGDGGGLHSDVRRANGGEIDRSRKVQEGHYLTLIG